jgi:hypothetical protein
MGEYTTEHRCRKCPVHLCHECLNTPDLPEMPQEMSRYFFHVVGGDRKYRDDNGLRFDSSQDAAAHAAKIAAELAQDGDQYRGFAVAVTDEDDRELKRVFVKLTDASS